MLSCRGDAAVFERALACRLRPSLFHGEMDSQEADTAESVACHTCAIIAREKNQKKNGIPRGVQGDRLLFVMAGSLLLWFKHARKRSGL